MDVTTLLIQNISSTSFFAMRPMLTSFALALLARGTYESAISTMGLLSRSESANLAAASWFASDTVLGVLLLLAVLELIANSNTDLRFWYEGASGFVQPGSSFVVSYGLVDAQAVYYVEFWIASLPADTLYGIASALGIGVAAASTGDVGASSAQIAEALSWLGHVLSLVWAALMAGGSWLIGRLRAAVLDLFFDLDDDDAIGAQSLTVWGEYGWAVVASYLIVFLPLIALALFGITVAGLWLARRYFEARERKLMVTCASCAGQMQPTALFCPTCRSANPSPQQVGLFGQPRGIVAADPAAHRIDLIGRKRCPVCATRLKSRDAQQACPACATVTFADIAQVNTFLRALDAKLPRTLLVSGLLSLVPLVGIVPAVIYYRLSLISSLRGYVPRGVGCMTRWGLRLVNLVLIMFQPVPLLGALVIPAMCGISYYVHRQVVLSGATSKIGRTFEPLAAPALAGPAIAAPALAAPAPAEAADCPGCGAANPAANRFCMTCGAPMR